MGRPYSEELDAFADTYRWVAAQKNIKCLQLFLQRWSGDHAVVVGSGGSYSAATAVSLFRELADHSPTTAATPLELISTLGRLSPRVLLLSAEGKNQDILAAMHASVAADVTTSAVTLTNSNPLVNFAKDSSATRVFSFQMDWVKDGFLATNSLLAMILLFYRAFFSDQDFIDGIGPLLNKRRITARRRYFNAFPAVSEVIKRGVLLLYSARAHTFAIDLESKLAEAAITSVQLTDLRQFAHGRHLQLSERSPAPFVITVFSKYDRALAQATTALLPDPASSFEIEIDGDTDQNIAVAGLIDAMLFTEALARGVSYDPGQPDVPDFGRAIHALDPSPLLRLERDALSAVDLAARRKAGVGLCFDRPDSHVLEAASVYLKRLTTAKLKAVVCDFDGTLCRAENRFDRMDGTLVERASSLMRQGITFAIATGRGDSLQTSLRESFAPELHELITVGYYSGSLIAQLSETFDRPAANPEFSELYHWLQTTSYRSLCKPPAESARGGQFSIRVPSPYHSMRLRGAIRAWLDSTKRYAWRVYCSGHSVDILDALTSKRSVVEFLASRQGIDPCREILRMGDSGREDGNDYELLNEGLSLSCDSVSADLLSCWNFGPRGNDQAETTKSYLGSLVLTPDGFQMSANLLHSI